jgi:hypothetical protein
MIARARILANPVIAVALASAIVITAAALGSSRLTMRYGDIPLKAGVPTVERIMVSAPELKLNVPHMHAAAVQGARGTASASSPALTPLISRTGKMSLYVQNVERASGAISSAARSNSGDVFSSDIATGDPSDGQPSATMEIRVPADRFDAAMNAVAQAGKVRERSTSAEDLTGSITDSDARLRNLRRTEADIRRIMDRSGSVSQIMDAENQLSQVREQIETLESDLKSMRGRVAYATIDIDMQAEAANAPVQPTPASQLASAWRNAASAVVQLTVGLAAAVVWLAVFVPYVLAVALVLWLVYAQARKRWLRA